MLYFHMADRCRGVGILDDIMRRRKNAHFYTLDIKTVGQRPLIPLLYCLPRPAISTCVKGIVEDECGTMTADFIQNYLTYLQDWFGQALKFAGINSNICDNGMLPGKPPTSIQPGHTGIPGLLEVTAPGTALDTVYGNSLVTHLHGLPGEKLCTTDNAIDAYQACVMSSDDKSEKGKFSILQFAHQLLPVVSHGPQCSRLEQFTTCWNLLQHICGPKVRGFEQHATLFVESCEIQSDMDAVGCHWQDMLLGHYIQASRVTVWPTVSQCLNNPMYLEDEYYSSFDSIMKYLDAVISLLQPGVEEISRKCGSQPAKRITSLLHTIRYLQRDALKYMILVTQDSIPD